MNEMSSALDPDALGGVTLATDGGVLRFSAGGVRFCVDLEQVGQVLFLPALQAVPGGPPYLVGLMELGRHSLPVVDLARRLGLAGAEHYGVNTPVLLCHHGDRRFGLIIDGVEGVAPRATGQGAADGLFQGSDLPYTRVVRDDRGQMLLLDVARLLGGDLMSGGTRRGSAP